MFLSVDSIAFVRLRRLHAQLSLPSFVPFFDQTSKHAKTKGTLEVVCTPMLKSVLARKHQKVSCEKLSVLFVCISVKDA